MVGPIVFYSAIVIMIMNFIFIVVNILLISIFIMVNAIENVDGHSILMTYVTLTCILANVFFVTTGVLPMTGLVAYGDGAVCRVGEQFISTLRVCLITFFVDIFKSILYINHST